MIGDVDTLKKHAVNHVAGEYLNQWYAELRQGIDPLAFVKHPPEVEEAIKVLVQYADKQFKDRAYLEVSQRLIRLMKGEAE